MPLTRVALEICARNPKNLARDNKAAVVDPLRTSDACMDRCYHRLRSSGYGQLHISSGGVCAPNCLRKMDARKKEGLCK